MSFYTNNILEKRKGCEVIPFPDLPSASAASIISHSRATPPSFSPSFYRRRRLMVSVTL